MSDFFEMLATLAVVVAITTAVSVGLVAIVVVSHMPAIVGGIFLIATVTVFGAILGTGLATYMRR